MSAFLQRERYGAVLMVRMNSPETRNALTTPEQFQELVDLCAELRQDHYCTNRLRAFFAFQIYC